MASGRYVFDEYNRPCFLPAVPVLPKLDAVADRLFPAAAAIHRFDEALAARRDRAPLGRLFAQLDAVHSSGAEGTTTTFTELVQYSSARRGATNGDAQTVEACARAFEEAAGLLDPTDAVLTIHRRLFENDANPLKAASAGLLKTIPNSTVDRDAPGGLFHYTRPADVAKVMAEWKGFTMASEPSIPELLRQLCSHWMFETIHPVADGNGRIGRLLVPLVLYWKGETKGASAFFGEAVHEDKDIYVDGLKSPRRDGDFTTWCRIGLSLMHRTADRNFARLQRLSDIQRRWAKLFSNHRKDSAIHLILESMLAKPAFTVSEVSAELRVSFAVANTHVAALAREGLIVTDRAIGRNRLFLVPEILDLFDLARAPWPPGGA